MNRPGIHNKLTVEDIKDVYLRTNRKNPQLRILFKNGRERSITLKKDPYQAKTLYQNIKEAIRNGILPDLLKRELEKKYEITTGDFYRLYIQQREDMVHRQELSSKTFKMDQKAVEYLLEYAGYSTLLKNSITNKDDFVRFLSVDDKGRKRIKNNSVNAYLRHLKAAFNWAVRKGYLETNPLEYLKKLKPEKKEVLKVFSLQEINQLLDYFKEHSITGRDVFLLALHTGMRADGVINLHKDNYYNSPYGPEIKVLEKGNKERIVPLNYVADEIIRMRMDIIDDMERVVRFLDEIDQPKNHRLKAINRAKQGYLFFEISRSDSITQIFTRAKDRLKLPTLDGKSFHTARHTFATNWLRNGGDLVKLQQILGHSDIKTTMVYLHLVPKDLHKDLDRLTSYEPARPVEVLSLKKIK